ncbi:MAG: TonB-dependent receptor, partial [Pseudomonadota bacterium]|nr:TonB-dependent receptor [Pseudomonadota bacterium]
QAHVLYSIELESGWDFSANAYINRFERSWNKFDGLISGPPANLVIARPDIFTTEIALLRGEIDSSDAADQLIDVTNNNREYGSQGGEIAASYVIDIGSTAHKLSAGIRFHHDYVERDHRQRGYEMVTGSLVFDGIENRTKKALNAGRTDAIAVFINDEIQWDSWTLNIGVRVEDIQREFDDFLKGEITANDETVVLPGAGILFQWSDAWAIFGGIHGGFSPAAPAAGNEVDSEESVNYEYGLRYSKKDLYVEAIGFFSDYSNLIGRCRVSDSVCGPGEEFSAGDVQIAGAELNVNYVHDFAAGWSLPIAFVYTYTESAFQDSFLSDFPQWGSVVSGDQL